ncbi:MAG TPA: Type 1 glutamine amidotransferase-like domain-containing protein [Candidatus Limnocylindrales bacterium]|nr:Type 1 glutamine amidotransferase-like domain-containing protein [Candidatus Limnocylindrales bacterium]
MPGPVALVGAGEFLPGMAAFDRDLLSSVRRARPRVVIVPAASAPDGEAVFRRWADLGVEHFASLGAEVEPVLVRSRDEAADEGAAQAVGEADLIYLSGGKPAHLRRVLEGSRLGAAILDAHLRGAILAGCSAGAMVLAERQPEFRRGYLPWPLRWGDGLGLVAGVAVLPHYDAWPEPVVALMALQAPRGMAVLGIDEDTAVVGRDGAWQVHGRARVTIWRGRHRERFRGGDAFRI